MFLFAFLRRGFGGRNRLTPDVDPPDPEVNSPPSTPTGLTEISRLANSVSFSWNVSVSNDALTLMGYKVYQDTALIATTNTATTSYTATGLLPSTTYSFTVKSWTTALDSAASSPLVLTTLADESPDPMIFNLQTGVAINTPITSNAVVVAGITAPVVVSVTSGEYQIDSDPFTSATGQISLGQSLTLKQTSSPLAITPTSQTVFVGSRNFRFVVTTGAGITLPDAFSFTRQTEVAVSTQIYSQAVDGFVAITGIDVAVPVSVVGGFWAKNDSNDYTDQDGTVVNNDTVAVRHTSSPDENTATNTTLYVGQGDAVFTSVTIQAAGDDISPTAFEIPYQTGLAINTVTEYGPVQILSINVPVAVGVGGNGNPQWKKDEDGAGLNETAWTDVPGTISVNEYFYIRATSSNLYYSPVIAYGTIGSLVVQYTLATTDILPGGVDNVPDAFAFVDVIGVPINSIQYASLPVPIIGIDTDAGVTVAGDAGSQWRVSGPIATAWGSASGSVSPGDSVEVRHTTATTGLATASTTLTIGGISATFTTTTIDDTEAPSPPVLSSLSPIGDTGFSLTWSAPFDNVGVTGYKAYYDLGGAYSTSFSATENPISESGVWSNSGGSDWATVQTSGGVAYGNQINAQDAYALLSGYGPDQSIEATVVSTGTFTANQEINLQLRRNDSAGTTTGYTVSIEARNTYAYVTRLDGGPAAIAFIRPFSFPRAPITGDTVKAQIVGSQITVYFNGALVPAASITDSNYATGSPGIGFFTRDAAQNLQFGWGSCVTQDFAAGAGPIEFYDDVFLQTSQTGIDPSTTTTYTVKAYDAASNLSIASNPQIGVTPASTNPNRTLTGVVQMDKFVVAGVGTVANGGGGGTFAISSVAGNNPSLPNVINHGQPVVISGALFGTKSTAAPVVWDDCSGTDPLSTYDQALPTLSSSSTYGMNYRAARPGVDMPHSNITKYLCGAHYSSGYGTGWNVMVFKGFPKSGYLYCSWYERVDPAWVHHAGDHNFKSFWYNNANNYSVPGGYLSYASDTGFESFYNSTVKPKWVTSVLPEQFDYPDANGKGSAYWSIASVNPTVWSKIEVVAKASAGLDGYWQLFQDGDRKINYRGVTDYFSGSTRYAAIGGYARAQNETSNWRYFADLYIDTTLERVLLCNSSNLDTATVIELQPPTAWTGSSITVTGNLGAFAADAIAYLFVIDAAGSVSNGVSVTIGS